MARKRWVKGLWVWVLIAAGAGTAVGVSRGEFGVVTQWAHTLCTSCIGLGR